MRECYVKLERLDENLVQRFLKMADFSTIDSYYKSVDKAWKKENRKKEKTEKQNIRKHYKKRKCEEEKSVRRNTSSKTKEQRGNESVQKSYKENTNEFTKTHEVLPLKIESVHSKVDFENIDDSIMVKEEESVEIWDVHYQDEARVADYYDPRQGDDEDDKQTVMFFDTGVENKLKVSVDVSKPAEVSNITPDIIAQILEYVSCSVKQLHEAHQIIQKLTNDMPNDLSIADYYKKVIMLEKVKFRKEVMAKLDKILSGFSQLTKFLKDNKEVIRQISERTFLDAKSVVKILSICVTVNFVIKKHKTLEEISNIQAAGEQLEVVNKTVHEVNPLESLETVGNRIPTQVGVPTMPDPSMHGVQSEPFRTSNGGILGNKINQGVRIVPPACLLPNPPPSYAQENPRCSDNSTGQNFLVSYNRPNHPMSSMQVPQFPSQNSVLKTTEVYDQNHQRRANFIRPASEQYFSAANNKNPPVYSRPKNLNEPPSRYFDSWHSTQRHVPPSGYPPLHGQSSTHASVLQTSNSSLGAYNPARTRISSEGPVNNSPCCPPMRQSTTFLPNSTTNKSSQVLTQDYPTSDVIVNQFSRPINTNASPTFVNESFLNRNITPEKISVPSFNQLNTLQSYLPSTARVSGTISTSQNDIPPQFPNNESSARSLLKVRKKNTIGNSPRKTAEVKGKLRAILESPALTDTFNPTIPQKLTMVNQRLQAGDVLNLSCSTKAKKISDTIDDNNEMDINRGTINSDTMKPILRNDAEDTPRARVYICAEKNCSNAAISVCSSCKIATYCSDECSVKHWVSKHKYECEKLNTLSTAEVTSAKSVS